MADLHVVLDACLVCEIGQDAGDKAVKAVTAGENALALGDRLGQLVAFPVLGRGVSERQKGRAQERQDRDNSEAWEHRRGLLALRRRMDRRWITAIDE